MRTDVAPPLSVSLLQTWPARYEPPPASESKSKDQDTPHDDAQKRREAAAAAEQRPLLAGNLRIELDQDAGRFVQTLTDPATNEVLRRFPHESQLAFARAVRAYERARLKE